jgi:hypothetical protein
MHGADVGVLGSAIPGFVALAPGSSGVVGLGVSGVYMLSLPGFCPCQLT